MPRNKRRGAFPIYTTGTTNRDNPNSPCVPFAGSFTNNGINHPAESALFNIDTAGEYTTVVQLRVTAGGVGDRGMYWAVVRRYKTRPDDNTRGTFFRGYFLGTSYYRGLSSSGDIRFSAGFPRGHVSSSTGSWRPGGNARIPTSPLPRHVFEVNRYVGSSLSRWCFIVPAVSVLLGVLSFFRAVSFAADQIVLASRECARVGRGETAINANHSSLITLGYVLRKGAQSNW